MLKKIISILMIIIMILSVSACGNEANNSDASSNADTSNSTSVNSSSVNITDDENIESEEENANSSDENSAEESEQPDNSSNNEPNNNSSNTNTKPPAKPNTKPNNNNTNSKPSGGNTGNNETSKEEKPVLPEAPKDEETKEPYFVRLEYVGRTYAYPYYVDGKNLVNRLFGDNYMQLNDTVTYRVIMSDGGTKGFELFGAIGSEVKIDGDKIIMKATDEKSGTYGQSSFAIKSKDKTGKTVYGEISYYVVNNKKCIIRDETGMYIYLRDYALSKGIRYYNGTELTGYTKGNEDLSITNYNMKGADDYIPIKAEVINGQWVFGNDEWVKKAIWLIDEYAKMGFTRWSFDVIYRDGLQSMAEK